MHTAEIGSASLRLSDNGPLRNSEKGDRQGKCLSIATRENAIGVQIDRSIARMTKLIRN
jgi:hypothetical protein